MTGAPHIPVLLEEVIEALAPAPGSLIVDATFGAGGYTRRLLDAGATVHAFDRDPDAIAAGQLWAETQGDEPRLVLHPRRFSEMLASLAEAGVSRVDGVVMDIGVSSMQLDQAERGFAFSSDGPLDMRMSQDGPSAADFLNEADEAEIADVLYTHGEERQSRRVARAIVAARPLETTGQLAQVIRKALGYRPHSNKGPAPKDPATRSFQAIRIHVNAELDELDAGLAAAEALLGEGGRLAVVSFHSLEDRVVKQFLRKASGSLPSGSRYLPEVGTGPAATFAQVAKAIRPSEAEVARNPRARSATLRSATRTAPAKPAPFREAKSASFRKECRMIVTRSRLQKIGWAAILTVCFAMLVALTFRVNAVKSEVRLIERKLVSVQQQKELLKTEFQTRASQRKLTALNDFEFGFKAPTPGQYLESERQLASLGKPRAADAPAPIMVASAAREDESSFPTLVNPLSGRAEAAETKPEKPRRVATTAGNLGARLSQVSATKRDTIRE